MPTLRLIISGKVQGVFYRSTAKKKAKEIGVTGWIMNTKEGNVEALVSGSELQLSHFIDWCHLGPDKALVQEVVIHKLDDLVFDDFTVKK